MDPGDCVDAVCSVMISYIVDKSVKKDEEMKKGTCDALILFSGLVFNSALTCEKAAFEKDQKQRHENGTIRALPHKNSG